MDFRAEYDRLMATVPRDMPDDFQPNIVEEDGKIVCRHVHDEKWRIDLGFIPSGDPFLDTRYRDVLRLSVWQACEWLRLGQPEKLEYMGLKSNGNNHYGIDPKSATGIREAQEVAENPQEDA